MNSRYCNITQTLSNTITQNNCQAEIFSAGAFPISTQQIFLALQNGVVLVFPVLIMASA